MWRNTSTNRLNLCWISWSLLRYRSSCVQNIQTKSLISHQNASLSIHNINPPKLGGFQRVLAVLQLKSQQKIVCSLPHLATRCYPWPPCSPCPPSPWASSFSTACMFPFPKGALVVKGQLGESRMSERLLIRIEQHCMALSNTETDLHNHGRRDRLMGTHVMFMMTSSTHIRRAAV